MAKIPPFKSEQEESDFWDTHDATEYLDDTEEIGATYIKVRNSRKEQISLRLEPTVIATLKVIADLKGIGYQTLIRMWVKERIAVEASDILASNPDNRMQEKSSEPREYALAILDSLAILYDAMNTIVQLQIQRSIEPISIAQQSAKSLELELFAESIDFRNMLRGLEKKATTVRRA